jgi:DNA-binding response OmpR family regulator
MSQTRVLVVEDDEAIRRGLIDALAFAGFDTVACDNGRAAVELASESTVDLVLLDVMLPELDGFGALEQIRSAHPTMPVIMVTARGAEEDRVRGLHNGADDYVIKPFSAKELLARVEAVLRRSPQRRTDVRSLEIDGRSIDLERRQVKRPDDSCITLTEREAAILRYLAVHQDRAVDRQELLHQVWGLNPKGLHTRTVDMHVVRLREKVEPDPSDPRIVLTVRGKGYMLGESVVTVAP